MQSMTEGKVVCLGKMACHASFMVHSRWNWPRNQQHNWASREPRPQCSVPQTSVWGGVKDGVQESSVRPMLGYVQAQGAGNQSERLPSGISPGTAANDTCYGTVVDWPWCPCRHRSLLALMTQEGSSAGLCILLWASVMVADVPGRWRPGAWMIWRLEGRDASRRAPPSEPN